MDKIIIFGAGYRGNEVFPLLKKEYEVIAFADNNQERWGTTFHDLPIIAPDQIKDYPYDEVIVSIQKHGEVGRQLEKMGIKNARYIRFADDEETGEKTYEKLSLASWNIYADCEFRIPRFLVEKERKKDNNADKKTVLMIAYSFPPEGGPAVQRTLKFAKYLPEFGYNPIVLTTTEDNKQMEDRSLMEEIPDYVKVVRVDNPYNLQYLAHTSVRQEIFDYFYSVSESKEWMREFAEIQWDEMPRLIPDSRMCWEILCLKTIEENVNMDEVDVIYSTVPAYSQHMLGYCIKKKYGIPWIGDYRDLWTSDERYYHLYYPAITDRIAELCRPLEKKLVQNMDAVIVAGGEWAEGISKCFDIPLERITEITNGYDEADYEGLVDRKAKNDKFTLCYNGRLHHPNRNPMPLLKAIYELIDAGKIQQDRIQWVFNGKVKESYAKDMMEDDKYYIVKQNGMVGHLDSMQSAYDSDLLVFYGEKGDNGKLNYPGKFYEYLRFGRPVLCISGHNSFQEKVLEETGLGKNFDHNEMNEIKEYILGQYLQWDESDSRIPRLLTENKNIERINRFERRNLTRKLATIIDELCR